MTNELQQFFEHWEQDTGRTVTLLRALPPDQYDFRPDSGGRSLGELAWHLAEIDAYASTGIAQREFRFDVKPPHIARPRTIPEFAPAFRVVHDDAVARIRSLRTSDLDSEIRYADGVPRSIRDLLWQRLLFHAIHHRGQLTMMCRLAGGVPPGLFGLTREEAAARRSVPSH